MVKKIINSIQFFISLLMILILIWPLINVFSNFILNENILDGIEKNRLSPPSLFPLLPFGTDIMGDDYLLKVSRAFMTNILHSMNMMVIFLFFGIIFGLGIGFRRNNENIFFSYNKISLIESFRRFISSISEKVIYSINTIPLLILIILSLIFCQTYIDFSIRQNVFLGLVGFFLTPMLAIPLSGRIRELIKQDFIIACNASGIHPFKIIFKHILIIESTDLIISKITNILLYSIVIDFFLCFFNKGSGVDTIGKLITASRMNLNPILWISLTNHQIMIAVIPLILLILININFQWLNERVLSIYKNG